MASPPIPPQEEGGHLDLSYAATATTPQAAHDVFNAVADRLLSINNWKDISGSLSSAFALVDARGYQVMRKARVGDYFKMDIPAPGPSAGNGSDWVRIQAIQDQRTSSGHSEMVSILVRPSSPPDRPGKDTAHFLDAEASSSFLVTRHDKIVTASVHSRNEKPNVEASSATDKVRNTVVAAGALLGFSHLQWRALLKGLFDRLNVSEHKV